ncbi:hypothetical protein [Nocardia brevicatena]|uniref:hypothetical protein n=1 Tax=Nocardia brevicatena TaxID=37327 RepID=UPI00031D2526|nr:hypothetical protein [Nocardia brevicatena]
MAGPYSDTEKKKYLEQVKKLLGQGYSLNAACRQVAERNGGRPSATSLTKWAKTAGSGNDAGPTTTAETAEKLGRVEGEDSEYRPGLGDLEKVDAALERQPDSAAGVAPLPIETTHTEGRSDQGAERDGNSSIAADPDPENNAQEQVIHQEPEPFTDNADPAGSESVQAFPAAVVDMPEEMEAVPEPTPRLRGMVTTMSEKIRALRNLVTGHHSR